MKTIENIYLNRLKEQYINTSLFDNITLLYNRDLKIKNIE